VLIGAAVWVMLWGTVSMGTAIAGVLVALLVVIAFPQPRVPRCATINLWPATVLMTIFAGQLIKASFLTAWIAVRPRKLPRGGIVAVHLFPAPEAFLATTAGFTSLVPGTLAVDFDPENCVLYVHVLDLDASGGPEKVRADTLDLETRTLKAFAPKRIRLESGLTS
jgi:multicomponent Na+:H+ antiporter subunit E